jgi:FkbM family methyltransferase
MSAVARNLKKCIPYSTKVWLREKVLNYYKIPCSRYGVPAPLVTRFQGKTGITLIDVGASKGDFTESMCRFCGVSKALLIEVQPKRCEELRQRFSQPTFQILCAAAGSKEDRMEIDILAWDYSTSLLKINRTDRNAFGTNDYSVRERIQTSVRPLDIVSSELGFMDEIDLLKLDVQGAEGMVLEGARETLQRVRAVWTEVSFRPLYENSIIFPVMYDLLRGCGFRLAALDDAYRGSDGELLQADALFVQKEAR